MSNQHDERTAAVASTSSTDVQSVQPFDGVFTQQEAIPEEAIESAIRVMRSGRLHRYNTLADEESEASLLEQEFADYLGVPHCLACASGGYAMQLALRAVELKPEEPVLTNAFTLSPVPGAIRAAGGQPVLVDSTRQLVIDLDALLEQIKKTGARILMLSHMRGHIVDMDQLQQITNAHQVLLIEDCAHTMGAHWNGKKCGTFGQIACFSTQTYKHINSGEGGLLTSRSPEIFASAVLHSGSYMLYSRNGTAPAEQYFENAKYQVPNCSGRMDNLRAAILRPQLLSLDANCQRWNDRYSVLAKELGKSTSIELPQRPEKEGFVASSLQFLIPGISAQGATRLLTELAELNVELKWFGNREPVGFTSHYSSWGYMESAELPATDAVLAELFDLRLPLTFSLEDCRQLGTIIAATVTRQ